jgi:dephospho-CoA kinase
VLRVGLTGGTGAGKSTVAARLAELGAVVLDADALAREVVAPGSEGLAAVAAEFGDGVLAGDGSLDRAALARLVFADPDRRRALEAITHPRIAARTAELAAAAPDGSVLVHDVPLLVEKHMGPGYHLVVVVDAPVELRVARLVGRGLTEGDARARIGAQATQEQRRAAADVWLDNSGDVGRLTAVVDRLWHDRLVPYAANLGAGRPAARPAAVAVVPYDPAWPAQAARLVERVRAAGGDAVRSVEHVGSTAVPGLAAKDVIDLQLVVDDLAAADALAGPLAAAGLPPYPGRWEDDGADGVRLAKRVHGSCDPGRAANLHVRPADSPFADLTVTFRDWLRAHPAERDAYAAVKAGAAGRPVEDYLAAKGPWVVAALGRARAWAPTGPATRRP